VINIASQHAPNIFFKNWQFNLDNVEMNVSNVLQAVVHVDQLQIFA